MKNLKCLFLFILISKALLIAQVPFSIQMGQCINYGKKDAYNMTFGYKNDSLWIKGAYSHNCGQTTIFDVKITTDSIIITTKDTGRLATCYCSFDFVMNIKASINDTIVVFNGQKYITNVKTSIANLEFPGCLIYLNPNPTDGKINITNKSNSKIRELSLVDINGKVILKIKNPSNIIDISNVYTGTYIIEMSLDNNKCISKKIVRN